MALSAYLPVEGRLVDEPAPGVAAGAARLGAAEPLGAVAGLAPAGPRLVAEAAPGVARLGAGAPLGVVAGAGAALAGADADVLRSPGDGARVNSWCAAARVVKL